MDESDRQELRAHFADVLKYQLDELKSLTETPAGLSKDEAMVRFREIGRKLESLSDTMQLTLAKLLRVCGISMFDIWPELDTEPATWQQMRAIRELIREYNAAAGDNIDADAERGLSKRAAARMIKDFQQLLKRFKDDATHRKAGGKDAKASRQVRNRQEAKQVAAT